MLWPGLSAVALVLVAAAASTRWRARSGAARLGGPSSAAHLSGPSGAPHLSGPSGAPHLSSPSGAPHLSGPSGAAHLSGPSGAARSSASVRGVLLLGLAVLAATGPALLTISGPARAFAGFTVLLLAPGAAVLGFTTVGDLLTELVLALAISMGGLALLAEVMVLQGAWQPHALYVVLAVTSAPLLAWHGAGSLAPTAPGQAKEPGDG